MDSSIIPLHIFHYIKTFLCLLLIISNISHFTFAAIALNGRINARPYDGFQFLEPALIPTGNYISLSGIMPSIVSNSTSSLPNSPAQDELITTILNVLDGLLTSPASSSKPISARRRRRRRAAGIIPSSSSGIRPLTTIRIPMGIFISDQSSDVQHDALLQQPGASKARLTSGLSRVIQRLRQSADSGGRQRGTFNYARTFNGLAPVEPVYIPRGYFIPLTPLLSGKQELPPTEASRPFAGIQPLTLTQLAGGIFIPHRMPALPNDIPSQIVPPGSEVFPEFPADAGDLFGEEDIEHLLNNGGHSAENIDEPVPTLPLSMTSTRQQRRPGEQP
ncbi:uncharacterized protein LOC129591633 isoform X2 [Paramacrobiotus metropolitanus]|uniref:uncharacterized protein LOC129591633 isoform X2 n=1 Tax=Paramacrobiotus metropolitanus TaxID=2943436 RepID=UPI0024459E44|nr:uncharacterized protein LOC129591633 isoform X2 [Paramacrobiotus metropolitanus]